jgi:NAD(P)-dependent dehydrogenase (short-subunit alcohol dehydrogenase family)
MTDLNGKVVLVTGSSRGIGAEIAVAFARQGAKVVLHGRDTEALAKVQADITNGGGRAMFVTRCHEVRRHRGHSGATEKNKAWIPEQQQQELIQSHPLRRLGTPQDVARAAVYLASDQASWITGVVLDISGGAVMV